MSNNQIIFENALKKIHKTLQKNVKKFDSVSPDPAAVGGMYAISTGLNWTDSFYVGTLWLDWLKTGDEEIGKAIEMQLWEFEQRLKQNRGLTDHDIGFLYILSAVAGYKLTQNEHYKDIAVRAADLLYARYHPEAKFLQAWGKIGARDNYRLIIDCMLNIPLLYWVAGETDNKVMWQAAYDHSVTTMNTIIRPDNSTYHTYYFDYDTKLPAYGKTKQGIGDDSTWSRGQAWAIYGFAIAYRYTKDPAFLDAAIRTADFMLSHLPSDLVCFWDLNFYSDEQAKTEPRDTSASAIAVCGMMEIAKFVEDDGKKKYYQEWAEKILVSLCENYMFDNPEAEALLDHGTYSIPDGCGIDEACVWGDYFFTEALVRVTEPEKFVPFW